jgi:hypothetical protein
LRTDGKAMAPGRFSMLIEEQNCTMDPATGIV